MTMQTTFRRLSDADLFWMRPWPTIFRWARRIGGAAIAVAAISGVMR
jgi:hypothetical protein